MSEEKLHAKYSPSSSERFVNCPGSIRLSAGIPPRDSTASVEGTNAHSLLERKLLGLPITKSFKRDIEFNEEMDDCTDRAAVVVKEEIAKASNPMNVRFSVEGKSDISHLVDADMWGTSDVILAEEFGTLHVMDYKHGKHRVSAQDNFQGLAYVLGVADKYDYNFESYKFTVIQPRLGTKKIHNSWEFDFERLMKAKEVFRRAVAESKKRDATLRTGSWCWFCPASDQCPQQKRLRLNGALTQFDLGD